MSYVLTGVLTISVIVCDLSASRQRDDRSTLRDLAAVPVKCQDVSVPRLSVICTEGELTNVYHILPAVVDCRVATRAKAGQPYIVVRCNCCQIF